MKLSELEKDLKQQTMRIFSLGEESVKNFALTVPPPHIKADVSLSWPLTAAKILHKPPLKIAEELAAALKGEFSCEAIRPGFVNINLSDKFLLEESHKVSEEGYFAAKTDGNAKKSKTVLEFVSANPTGPMHLASGRGATLGDSMARIMRAMGDDISTEFYVNNVGHQVERLGASLKARYNKQEPPEDGYHGDYLIAMAEQLPPEAAQWTETQFSSYAVEKILARHKKDMEMFGVKFDCWFLESSLHEQGIPKKTLEEIKKKGRAYEKDGATWFGASSELGSDDKDRVLVKNDGRNTYFLNDIANHLNKYARGFDKAIDIFGADHHGYVARLSSALEALGHGRETFRVIIHQQVALLRDGETIKMSKRAGEFISLRDLVEEVGLDACRFFFASRGPNTHLNFDVNLAKKKSNDNPVFYVQYVHARICSIFANAAEKGIDSAKLLEAFDISKASLNAEERALLAKFMWLERVLVDCVRDFSPHHITTYLTELAALFHSFYDKHKVLAPENIPETAKRLYILRAVKGTIAAALALIGVSAPEKM